MSADPDRDLESAQTVGGRIRDLRRARGLSQSDLAGDGLSASYVSLLENGRRVPSAPVIAKIAERLEVSARFLLTGQEDADAQRLRAEVAFVRLAVEQGDHRGALVRGQALVEALGDGALLEELHFLLAAAHEQAGDLEEACRLLEPLAAGTREGLSELPLAPVHMLLASSYLEAGDVARAAEVADAGLEVARTQGWLADPEVARLAATAVWAYLERGDALYACLRADDYLGQLGDGGHPASRGSMMWNAALAQHARGRHQTALALLNRASALLGEGHDGRDLPRAALAKAWLMLRASTPDVDGALRLLRDARSRLEVLGSPTDLATCETEMARAYLFSGGPEQAKTYAEAALSRLGPAHRLQAADAAAVRGQALVALGREDDVKEALDIVRRHLLEVPLNRDSAPAWAGLAVALRNHGDDAGACDAAMQAMAAAGLRTMWHAWGASPQRQPSRPPLTPVVRGGLGDRAS